MAISRGLPLLTSDVSRGGKMIGRPMPRFLVLPHQISHFTSQAAPSSTQASTLLILQSQLAMFLPRKDAGFARQLPARHLHGVSSLQGTGYPHPKSLSDYLSAVLAISQHRAGLAISFHELLLHSLIRSNITTSAGAFSPTNHWVSIAPL